MISFFIHGELQSHAISRIIAAWQRCNFGAPPGRSIDLKTPPIYRYGLGNEPIAQR